MPRYRGRDREQALMVPVHFSDQIQPGTFEHAIDYLVDNEIDLSSFEARYKNDETEAPAIHPGILLQIVLFAYSRGIVSSRRNRHAATLYSDRGVYQYHWRVGGEGVYRCTDGLLCRRADRA